MLLPAFDGQYELISAAREAGILLLKHLTNNLSIIHLDSRTGPQAAGLSLGGGARRSKAPGRIALTRQGDPTSTEDSFEICREDDLEQEKLATPRRLLE
jgi:hypothetical protein